MNQTTPRVMLLIDADNVTADVIEQAVQQVMARHGAIHVRRAYCTAELALKQLKLFKTHSIRPIVNVSTGKNSTDIALAVDAMDLVVAERPELVVIVSSDSDFAPLVIRLREKGCRVEGIGQEGKTGEDSKPVYDAFIDLPHRKAKAAPARASSTRAAPAKRAAKSAGSASSGVSAETASAPATPAASAAPPRTARSRAASPRASRATQRAETASLFDVLDDGSDASAAVASRSTALATPAARTLAPAPTPAPAPRKRAARGSTRAATGVGDASASTPPAVAVSPAPVAAPAPRPQAPRPPAALALPEEVTRILAALPELRSGGRLQLNLAKERLCNAGLLAKSAPSTKLFRKHPALFALTPEAAPNKVQYLRPAGS